MSVDAGIAIELDIDLHAAVTCTAISGCDSEATWSVVNRPCDHSFTLCSRHRDQERASYANAFANGWPVLCGVCLAAGVDAEVMREDWYPL